MQIKDFEKITIGKIDGKRAIEIDGEQIDLSEIVSMNIYLSSESHIEVETTKKEFLEW